MVHPASHRVSRALWYSGTGLSHFNFHLREYHPLCWSIPEPSINLHGLCRPPTTPEEQALWFGLVPVRSPLLGESQLISIPLGTEMFHFPRFALTTYEFSCQ